MDSSAAINNTMIFRLKVTEELSSRRAHGLMTIGIFIIIANLIS